MPLENIPSVLVHGILSHERASKLSHKSVAMVEIQERRDKKKVPGGLKLHQYANLYFHARNPMLYKRKAQAASLCVLQVSTTILNEPDVVITDSNAAGDYVRFLSPRQWKLLCFDDILAMDWRDDDPIALFRRRSRKCAEILVPHSVPRSFLLGARVVDRNAQAVLAAHGFDLPTSIDPVLFFRS